MHPPQAMPKQGKHTQEQTEREVSCLLHRSQCTDTQVAKIQTLREEKENHIQAFFLFTVLLNSVQKSPMG